jgi:hypothetical protein
MAINSATPTIASSRPPSQNDVGTIPAATQALGVSKKEYGVGPFRQTVFTFNNSVIPFTDYGAGGGAAALQLLDLPEGHIGFYGAVTDFTSLTVGAGIGATSAVVHSLGTAAEVTGTTLDSTQANVMPSTSLTLVASTGAVGGVNTAVAFVDGTATANDLFLNFAADATAATANTTITVNGTIVVTWALLGNN